MIGQIRGLLMMTEPPLVMVDVAGLGYEVQAPLSVFNHMPHVGDEVTLITHHLVKEDSHTLYGFLSREDRECCIFIFVTFCGYALFVLVIVFTDESPKAGGLLFMLKFLDHIP